MFENLSVPKHLVPADPRFTCGPSLIPVEHVQSLLQTGKHLLGTSHRKSAVKNIVKEINQGLKDYFQLPPGYLVVMGNGGATLLFDLIGLSLVEKKSAHFTCGEFSEKWYESHKKIPWIQAEKIAVAYGEGITPKLVDGVDMICTTLNETSTGVQVDRFPEHVPDSVLLAVDATSGGGQVPCPVGKVDLFFFSPQKVFASDGGLWVMIMSPKAQERALKILQDKNRYIPEIMNLKYAMENAKNDQTYNTPALVTLFLLNEQVKKMNQLGQEKVIQEAQEKARVLYSWAESKSYLSCYIKEEKYRSLAVATIDVDAKIKVEDLIKYLEKNKMVYGIDAYRKLGRNQFRIAFFHNISLSDVTKLTELLSFAIEGEL